MLIFLGFVLWLAEEMAFSWSVFIVILLSILGFRSCHARIFSFQMHHRFSEPVKKWSEGAGNGFPAGNWPAKGSFEYYAELAHRDRALRGRRLSDIDGLLTFSDGNSTFRISSLGLYDSFCYFLLFPWLAPQ